MTTIYYKGKPLRQVLDFNAYKKVLQRIRTHPEYTVEQCVDNDELFRKTGAKYRVKYDGKPLRQILTKTEYNRIRARCYRRGFTVEEAMNYVREPVKKHKRTDYAREFRRKQNGCPRSELHLPKEQYKKIHPSYCKYFYKSVSLKSYCQDNGINYDNLRRRILRTGINDIEFLIETLNIKLSKIKHLYFRKKQRALKDIGMSDNGAMEINMKAWGWKNEV